MCNSITNLADIERKRQKEQWVGILITMAAIVLISYQ
jgi:hypothetical protein